MDLEDDCPICCNAFPATDRDFRPCPCGFRICVWCWQRLQSADFSETLEKPRCPQCREPLNPNPPGNIDAHSPVHARFRLSRVDQKRIEPSKKPLIPLVVADRRVVVVEGLPRGIFAGNPVAPLRHELFGQYGRVVNYVVFDNTIAVRYHTPSEAELAQSHIDGARICHPEVYEPEVSDSDGPSSFNRLAISTDTDLTATLTARIVNSRWCTSYLKSVPCTRRRCIDLHEPWRKHDMPAVPGLDAADLVYFTVERRPRHHKHRGSGSLAGGASLVQSNTPLMLDVEQHGRPALPFLPPPTDVRPACSTAHAIVVSVPPIQAREAAVTLLRHSDPFWPFHSDAPAGPSSLFAPSPGASVWSASPDPRHEPGQHARGTTGAKKHGARQGLVVQRDSAGASPPPAHGKISAANNAKPSKHRGFADPGRQGPRTRKDAASASTLLIPGAFVDTPSAAQSRSFDPSGLTVAT
jgi:hypothetical protein